jgi:hypothetical protein
VVVGGSGGGLWRRWRATAVVGGFGGGGGGRLWRRWRAAAVVVAGLVVVVGGGGGASAAGRWAPLPWVFFFFVL